MSAENILITGANGYLGLHVIHDCILKGWNVVAAVRTENAAARIRSIFPDATSSLQIDLVQITGITNPESLKPAFRAHRPVTAIINLASPLINNPEDARRDVLDPAIQAGTAILEAARRFGAGKVHRVVHTSSCAAVLNPHLGDAPGHTYTADDWNPTTYDEAATGGDAVAYMGSKALAERAMWDWMKTNENSVSFDFVSVAPAGILGPHYLGALEDKGESLDLTKLNLSSQMLWVLADPTAAPTPYNSYHFGCWVDVRTASATLVAAVTHPDAGGQRFICAQRCHWQLVRNAARAAVPELRNRIDVGVSEDAEAAKKTTYDIDGSKVTTVLGVKYTSMEDATRDSFAQLLEAERQRSSKSHT